MVVEPSKSSLTITTIKLLCSYGGKILPRYPDHKLCYHGGQTRLLAIDRSTTFADLQLKLQELCGASTFLRCQLPMEDLDSLVSITSDEDLTNLIEEYDRTCSPSPLSLPSLKIRAFLSLPKPIKQDVSPSRASASSNSSSSMAPWLGPARCLHQQIQKLGMSRKRPGEWKIPRPYCPKSGSYYVTVVTSTSSTTGITGNNLTFMCNPNTTNIRNQEIYTSNK